VPASIQGIVVDVRIDPRPARGGAATGMLLSAASGSTREELAVPTFAGELTFEETETPLLAAASAGKPQVHYEPPPGVSLERMKVEMSLILHASPEQGWTQLQKFLKDIQQELVVGVYEFTAPHIEKAILDGLKSPEKLTLTLDSPPAKKSREQTVEQTEQHLAAKLKRRLSFAWALSGYGHDAPAKAFPTSYHIKVAVKDGKSMWLSSGNWNTSNQPNVDPQDQSALAAVAQTAIAIGMWFAIAPNWLMFIASICCRTIRPRMQPRVAKQPQPLSRSLRRRRSSNLT
jgi:hypothetical protein